MFACIYPCTFLPAAAAGPCASAARCCLPPCPACRLGASCWPQPWSYSRCSRCSRRQWTGRTARRGRQPRCRSVCGRRPGSLVRVALRRSPPLRLRCMPQPRRRRRRCQRPPPASLEDGGRRLLPLPQLLQPPMPQLTPQRPEKQRPRWPKRALSWSLVGRTRQLLQLRTRPRPRQPHQPWWSCCLQTRTAQAAKAPTAARTRMTLARRRHLSTPRQRLSVVTTRRRQPHSSHLANPGRRPWAHPGRSWTCCCSLSTQGQKVSGLQCGGQGAGGSCVAGHGCPAPARVRTPPCDSHCMWPAHTRPDVEALGWRLRLRAQPPQRSLDQGK